MTDLISQARLRQRLHFEPTTGTFTWLPCSDVGEEFNAQWPGKAAGFVDQNGRRAITVDGRKYYAHELAWFYLTGEWQIIRGGTRALRKKRRA